MSALEISVISEGGDIDEYSDRESIAHLKAVYL